MREPAAAFPNHPPMWLSTASLIRRSLPTREISTGIGTLPFRKPGIFRLPARSDAACSTACLTSALGTSTVRRTRSPPSSSTCVCTRPIQPERLRATGCPGRGRTLRPDSNIAPRTVRPSRRKRSALQRVVEYGGYVNLVLFTVVGLVALRQWRLGRGRAGLWAAVTFGTLALVVDVAPLLDETPDRPVETFLQRALIAALVLFPYLLYRFATSFQPPTRRLERLLGLMTLTLLVWTFVLPEIPAEGEPRSTGFLVYLAAFLFHWTVFSLVVAVRLWRGARAAPTVARRRLRVLAGA